MGVQLICEGACNSLLPMADAAVREFRHKQGNDFAAQFDPRLKREVIKSVPIHGRAYELLHAVDASHYTRHEYAGRWLDTDAGRYRCSVCGSERKW